jgi:hypothetical protein
MSKDEAIATIALILAPVINRTRENPMPQIREVIETLLRDSQPAIKLGDYD